MKNIEASVGAVLTQEKKEAEAEEVEEEEYHQMENETIFFLGGTRVSNISRSGMG